MDKKTNVNSAKSKKNGPAQGKQSITTDKSTVSPKVAPKNKKSISKTEIALESAGTISKTKTSAKSSVKKDNEKSNNHLPTFSPEPDTKSKR